MGTKAIVAGLLAMVCALSGCAERDPATSAEAPAMEQGAPKISESAFAFGAGSVRAESRVTRSIATDGGETLHGTTEVRLAGEAHPLVITETAKLGPDGRLISSVSELRSGPRGEELVRSVRLDAKSGMISTRDDRGESVMVAAVDQPWVVENLFAGTLPIAESATAVQAWIARRSIDAGERVRVIDVGARRSFVTLAGQVVMEDGGSRKLVILGDEVVEVDSSFVRSLPWKALEQAASAERQSATSCEPGPV